MLNEAEVAEAMAAAYPSGLCGAGIGGTVRLPLYLTEDGSVERAKIRESSGHEQLDDVALSLAGLYRFSPAITWDERLPVSVLVTVRFKVGTWPGVAA
jgi:TonB family protein